MCISQKELNKLDLRNQSVDATLVQPTASDLLQHIGDKELNKMLKVYGELGQWSKFVTEVIIEARYMFHRFETIQVS